MKKELANSIPIVAYFVASFFASNMLDTPFWHIMSVAFLIAGAYGIVCVFKNKKFLF